MKKILLTGVNGQVGHALLQAFESNPQSYNLITLDRSQLDLTDVAQLREIIQTQKPDLIINPAAYTAVDRAESEPELAFAINAKAPQILAEEAAKLNAGLIHFSTDYVYDGCKAGAYLETDRTNPVSVYGQSKLAGEDAIRAVGVQHLIFRTSWVYGAYGKNFLKTILWLAQEREELRVVADQIGAPTSSQVIAQAVLQMVSQTTHSTQHGTYHLVNAGQTSWHAFANAIVEEANSRLTRFNKTPLKVKTIQPIGTEQYPTPAKRPANSVLNMNKLLNDFGIVTPHWRDSLRLEIEKLGLENWS